MSAMNSKESNSATAERKSIRIPQFNEVRLSGRLTRDPMVRNTPNGNTVAQLNVAMNRSYKDKNKQYQKQADFITVTAWGELAKNCQKRLLKGSPVLVEGRLSSESWSTNGQKRFGVKVLANRVQFLEIQKPANMADIPFGD